MPIRLADLTEDLQRRLYDAFQLQIRYSRSQHAVVLRITIREDTLHTITEATPASPAHRAHDQQDPEDARSSHLLRGPNGEPDRPVRDRGHANGCMITIVGRFDVE